MILWTRCLPPKSALTFLFELHTVSTCPSSIALNERTRLWFRLGFWRGELSCMRRALQYDLALREIYYMPGREFRVILLESDTRRGKGGWTDASYAARKALDPAPWRIVEATTDGDWTLE